MAVMSCAQQRESTGHQHNLHRGGGAPGLQPAMLRQHSNATHRSKVMAEKSQGGRQQVRQNGAG